MKYGLQYDAEKHDIIYVEDGVKKARMKCGCTIRTSRKGEVVPMDAVFKQFRQARVELWKIPENVTLGCPRLTLSNGELQKDCFGRLEISHLPMEILNKPVSHYKVEVSNGMLLLVDSILGVSYNLRELSLHGWELAHPNGFRENSGNITRYIHVNAVVRNNKLKVDVDKAAIAEAQKKADAITKDWQRMVFLFKTAMTNATLETLARKKGAHVPAYELDDPYVVKKWREVLFSKK